MYNMLLWKIWTYGRRWEKEIPRKSRRSGTFCCVSGKVEWEGYRIELLHTLETPESDRSSCRCFAMMLHLLAFTAPFTFFNKLVFRPRPAPPLLL